MPFSSAAGLTLGDFDGFLLHPGGSKILDTAEAALGIRRDQLCAFLGGVRDYGNMSSATALFVLSGPPAQEPGAAICSAAFGPGFSAYFVSR